MLNYLRIEVDVDEEKYMEDWHRERRSASLVLRLEGYIQSKVLREPSSPRHSDDDDHPERFDYDAHVETDDEADTLERVEKNRRHSLFDYGGNN